MGMLGRFYYQECFLDNKPAKNYREFKYCSDENNSRQILKVNKLWLRFSQDLVRILPEICFALLRLVDGTSKF